jgi:hypothetical protein
MLPDRLYAEKCTGKSPSPEMFVNVLRCFLVEREAVTECVYSHKFKTVVMIQNLKKQNSYRRQMYAKKFMCKKNKFFIPYTAAYSHYPFD